MRKRAWKIDQIKLVGIALALAYHFFIIARMAGQVEQRIFAIEREIDSGRPLVERFFKTEERVNAIFGVCCKREATTR